jgi:starch synthase
MTSSVRVLLLGSELFPLVKTGGLADVLAALPVALQRVGVDARLLLPAYPALLRGLSNIQVMVQVHSPWPVHVQLLKAYNDDGIVVYLIDAPDLYQREGSPYQQPDGQDWSDNLVRFALLGWMSAYFGDYVPDFVPDVLHGHDWHAGLMPPWLKQRPTHQTQPVSVLTIHNLAYTGSFPLAQFAQTGLPSRYAQNDGLEFYGKFSFLKGGLQLADALTAVSPRYAEEICQAGQGMGFEGLLTYRRHRLYGILNGMDNRIWGPQTGMGGVPLFDAQQPQGKQHARQNLQAREGLPQDPTALLCVVVSRLVHQKGLDLILEALPTLMQYPIQLVVLGRGDADLSARFCQAAQQWPNQMAVRIGYTEDWAHQTFAGGDVMLMPSRHEPCGLTQLYALRYGTLPIVNPVGGLVDTVKPIPLDPHALNQPDCPYGTGFYLSHLSADAIIECIHQVIQWRQQRPDCWQQWQQHAMSACFDWSHAAKKYLELYRQLMAERDAALIITSEPHPACL